MGFCTSARVSTLVDCETKNTGFHLSRAVIFSRGLVSDSPVKSVKSPSCWISGEIRRVSFPFPVASPSADIFSVRETFHFPHLPAADENATVIVQKYFYGLTNSSEQMPSNKELLP